MKPKGEKAAPAVALPKRGTAAFLLGITEEEYQTSRIGPPTRAQWEYNVAADLAATQQRDARLIEQVAVVLRDPEYAPLAKQIRSVLARHAASAPRNDTPWRVVELWGSTLGKQHQKVAAIAAALNVGKETVRKHAGSLGLMKPRNKTTA